MICPVCGAKTFVKKSRLVDGSTRVVRRRQCLADGGHGFDSVEQRTDLSLSQVLVRKSGGGQLTEQPFDRDRLLRDVRTAVLKRLDDRATQALVNDVVSSLEARLPQLLEPLSESERQSRPEFMSCIPDTVISHAVDRRLRTTNRLAQVLYAMSILGREDRRGRQGWQDAGDVLRWLYAEENYPDLATALPVKRRRAVENWFPLHVAPRPERVIKRATDQLVPFDHVRFTQSIRKAMLGRKNADERSLYVSEWVLWRVEGHTEVLSAQLAVEVMACLRRVDDIAYLRWASTAKSVDRVTRFRDEALRLITHPSPALRFNPEMPSTALRSGGLSWAAGDEESGR